MNLHHVFGEGNVPVLVMLVLNDEDCVEPRMAVCKVELPPQLSTMIQPFKGKVGSYLERIVGMKSMFSSALVSSHLPNTELAAARTEHLLLRVVVMPALAIEMVCCSMAS